MEEERGVGGGLGVSETVRGEEGKCGKINKDFMALVIFSDGKRIGCCVFEMWVNEIGI